MKKHRKANLTTKNILRRSVRNTDTDLKYLFLSADSRLVIDKDRKSNTIDILRKEIECKEVCLVVSKRKIWLNQMRYADRSMYFIHLPGCAFMLFLMVMMDIRNVDSESMITFSMILAGMLGSLSILGIGKVCFAELAELGETCFFSVSQMTAFEMIRSGVINLTALAAGIFFAGSHWKIHLLQLGLYLLVPFIFTQCICLGALLTEIGRRNAWLIAAIGAFLSVFYVILASTPRLYIESALFIWVIALIVGMAVFGIQINTLFREIGKGEILCTN